VRGSRSTPAAGTCWPRRSVRTARRWSTATGTAAAPPRTQAIAYSDAVASTGSAALLAQRFVDRPGHCQETPAELLASVADLEHRLATGAWQVSAPDLWGHPPRCGFLRPAGPRDGC
jgi:hypothetical protein